MVDIETLTPIVARVLRIEDITRGDAELGYLVRYRGQLYGDSAEAYDRLAESLYPDEITPMFREEQGQHVVLLVQGIIQPRPSNPLVNLGLFILTLVSVIFAGALYLYTGPAEDLAGLLLGVLRSLPSGIPFAVSLLAILLAHEFGHYLVGRYHRAHVTLPYFLPFPLSPFGTMGAFIQMKAPPKNRRVLLDIGIAGPIAGLLVTIPVLLIGLSLSETMTIEHVPGQSLQLEGNSLLYLLAKFTIFGELLPAPQSYGDVSPLLYWVRYFFTSQPFPEGGRDVLIHPVAWAGWAGLLVTALNLIPAGQLDGGHVISTLLGRRARLLFPLIIAILIMLGFFWSGWWLWAFLLFLLGRVYAEPLDQITRLDPRRKAIAVLGVILFILVFTPVPLTLA
ncbi:MAG: site-2 protease family protein [Anaerolineales bacterium]|nr:site-2 protease family protein [Anaerolineales bacterium]